MRGSFVVVVGCAVALGPVFAKPASAGDRMLRAEVVVDAPVAKVWEAWTTEAGVQSFFARGAHIEPRVDGAYEIFFDPSQPPGQRGGDGMRILALEPNKRLAFTWNAPPTQPVIRAQRTMVILDFAPAGSDRTRLRFSQVGWGEGPEWDTAFGYFDKAWGHYVLPRLVQRFRPGGLDPASKEPLPPIASTIAVEMAAATPR